MPRHSLHSERTTFLKQQLESHLQKEQYFIIERRVNKMVRSMNSQLEMLIFKNQRINSMSKKKKQINQQREILNFLPGWCAETVGQILSFE